MKSKYSEYAYYLSRMTANDRTYIIPPSVEIDLTNSCNQDCTYCNVAVFRNEVRDRTKIHDYHSLIDDIASWSSHKKNSIGNVNTVTFVGGGEPTARKGYEYVLEQAIDNNFLVSLITNGSRLEQLENISQNSLSRISWVGVDIDSGDEEIYEQVRRSKQDGLYHKVKENIKWLTSQGINVDIKSLLFDKTITQESIDSTLRYCKEVNARMVYFRLALIDGSIYQLSDFDHQYILDAAKKIGVKVSVNKSRMGTRTYSKCHALHLIPVFSSDGNIYTCCENRGNDFFKLCNWTDPSFKDVWMSEKHFNMYQNLDLNLCKPCRPHSHNIEIDNLITSKDFVSDMFF